MKMLDFYKKKQMKEKVCMITCYDYTSARILAKTNVDCLLVGDSAAMMMHGCKDTLSATIEMMQHHTVAVHRGAGDKFIVADLPFMSYRKSFGQNVSAAQKLIQAGAHAVKIENVSGNENFITHLSQSGVPVMGHLGLTPQFIHTLGGYHAQGKSMESANRIKADALRLQDAGCFSLVLECVPMNLAKEITESLSISTIGIGSGPFTDGQVLVFQDVLGLNMDFKPRFVQTFLNGYEQFKNGIETFIHAVQLGRFPTDEHCYDD